MKTSFATALLPLFVVLPACSMPTHEARTEQEFRVPADGLRALACETHNGDVHVTSSPGSTEVMVHATLSARGYTEAEAKSNLDKLTIRRDIKDGRLSIAGVAPDSFDWGTSPSFAFTLTAPPALACELISHNGGIAVHGMQAAVDATSHNGAIEFDGAADRVALKSHNGRIRAAVGGDGPLDGVVETHNGQVEIAIAEGRSTSIEAATHNGSLRAVRALQGLRVTDSSLTGKSGDGRGKLSITSHNGDVVIR